MGNTKYNTFILYRGDRTVRKNITFSLRKGYMKGAIFVKEQEAGMMERTVMEFINYLRNTKKTSDNTVISYQRDLKKFRAYLMEKKIKSLEEVTELDLENYLRYMEENNQASSTISRSVASIRALYQFLFNEGRIASNPALLLKPPKVEKKMPEILSVEEVDLLLQQPDQSTPKGIRDTAMLELLYATGMRVSELIHLHTGDVNLKFGYVTCHDNGKERVIPIGYAGSKRIFCKGPGRGSPVYQLFRQGNEPPGLLESIKRIRGRRGYKKRHYPPYPPPLFCSTYAAERGRCEECAGNAGTFRHIHHPDLSGRKYGKNERSLYEGTSQTLRRRMGLLFWKGQKR